MLCDVDSLSASWQYPYHNYAHGIMVSFEKREYVSILKNVYFLFSVAPLVFMMVNSYDG